MQQLKARLPEQATLMRDVIPPFGVPLCLSPGGVPARKEIRMQTWFAGGGARCFAIIAVASPGAGPWRNT